MDRLGYKERVCKFASELDGFVSVLDGFQNGVYITPTLRALAGVIFPVTDALQGRKSAQLKLSSCGKLLM